MFALSHLTLRLVRLQKGEKWFHEGDGLAFLFPQSGAARYEAGSLVQSLSPGDVLVVNGVPNSRLLAGSGAEFLFWWFQTELEHLYPLFSVQEIGALHNVHQAYRSMRLYAAATPVAKACKKLLTEVPPPLNLEHRGHVIKLAAAILSKEFAEANTQRAGFLNVEEHVKQVLERLSIEELLDLSVSELAEKFNCSRRHLNRLFHQYFGLSVAALRMEMRLLKAVSLLRDSEVKIINVADDCGFNHLGLFNMCFKKRFGITPGDWRKRNQASKSTADTPVASPDYLGCRLGVNGLCPWNVNHGGHTPTNSPSGLAQSHIPSCGTDGEQSVVGKGPRTSRMEL